jgi:uncharacterized protein YbjT (DUF2867 family)
LRVALFGATGMVGQGVLRECLLDPEVTSVLSIGRSASGKTDPKLRDIIRPDLFDYSAVEKDLSGLDACFFCLGLSSVGMNEVAYRRVTYDLTVTAARVLARLNPQMTFVYVSGAGTDSTERGRIMWARVKGATENALLRLPFKAAYMFRPGAIQPMHGVRSKTPLYRVVYALTGPFIGILRRLAPGFVTTTQQVGRAMLIVVKQGAPKLVLESADINRL